MAKSKVLLFIPIYNCEKQIVRVLNQLNIEICEYISEVIIVNNISTDDSESVIIEYLKSSNFSIPINLLRNKENYSLGGSHKVAFNYAIDNSFDHVVVLHGDDQGNINDILNFLKNSTIQNYDSMLGSRFMNSSTLVNYSKFRIFGNHVVNNFISLLLFKKITDMGSGLNIYKTEYLRSRFYLYFPNNLTFNVYLLLYGIYINSKFCYFPITWREDDQVSNAKLFDQTIEILGLVIKYRFRPQKVFSLKENGFSKINYSSTLIYTNLS